MRSLALATTLLVLIALTAVGAVRASSARDFVPAAAATVAPQEAPDARATGSDDLQAPLSISGAADEPIPASAADAPVTPVSAAVPTDPPVRLVAAPAPAAAPVRQAPAQPAPATPPPAATESCAANWICYPRLGVAGPIVPYTDCGATTDIGTAIRSLACFSERYLVGHAYTQFGRITGFRAGDVVFAYGQRFTVDGSFIQRACEPPARVAAPLSLQTSLTSQACGEVLIVTAR